MLACKCGAGFHRSIAAVAIGLDLRPGVCTKIWSFNLLQNFRSKYVDQTAGALAG